MGPLCGLSVVAHHMWARPIRQGKTSPKVTSTYSQGNMEKFWGENVRSTPTSITSGWIESSSTDSREILGGVWLFMFTFVGASRGHVSDSTAFLFCIFTLFSALDRRLHCVLTVKHCSKRTGSVLCYEVVLAETKAQLLAVLAQRDALHQQPPHPSSADDVDDHDDDDDDDSQLSAAAVYDPLHLDWLCRSS